MFTKPATEYRILIILAVIFLISTDAFSQCAMCRASAESSLKNGSTLVKGLNVGILYLMAIPYLSLCFIFRAQLKSFFFRLKSRWNTK